MTLIKSISGIRGTIGEDYGKGLNPINIVKFTLAFSKLLKNNKFCDKQKVVIGRDARLSGDMVNNIVIGTLISSGIDVIDIGLATTPTVEMAVVDTKADGGIIITASHNSKEWNALKLLNNKGEFISAKDGEKLIEIVEKEDFYFAEVDKLGVYSRDNTQNSKHISKITQLPLVDVKLIKSKKFKVAIDAVNSVGNIIIPLLLSELGVESYYIHSVTNGLFERNPEPLPENLTALATETKKLKCDVSFAVDPDVDRLAIVCENGEMFGEEYTLVAVADYVLSNVKGAAVSNLSSTKALSDICKIRDCSYYASAVGEVNVVEKMKETNAIIGGEGNGGIIYPELHYGRDALVGIALFLTALAQSGVSCSEFRKKIPNYFIVKKKIKIDDNKDVDFIFNQLLTKYSDKQVNIIDGLKIDFSESWVHLRKSNTEPIIRVYSEAKTFEDANELADIFINEIKSLY